MATATNWPEETALDVEWAHAIAPAANILLVIAPSNSGTDLTMQSIMLPTRESM